MFKENIEAIKWLISVSKGNRVYLLFSIVLALLGGCVSMIPFVLFYKIITITISGTAQSDRIWELTLATLIAIITKYVLQFSATMCSHRAAFFIQYNMRKNLLEHVGGLSLGFFNKRSSGLLRKITSEDVENLEIYIAHHIPDTVMSIVVPVVIFGILLSQNAFLPLILVIPFLLMLAALSRINKIRKRHVKEYYDNTENMNSATIEYIKAIPIIKIFNVTVESFEKFNKSIQKQIEITSEWIKKSSPFFVLFKSSLDFVLPLLMLLLAFLIYFGLEVDSSIFILCFMLGAAMAKPVNQIYTSSNLLCSLMEGANRVEQIMKMKTVSETERSDETVKDFNISFHKVSFAYDDKRVLKNINIDLSNNGLYALVGESGSGKTTTAQLLLRFWDVCEGNISIGHVDIKKLPLDFLLQHISFSFQDSFIIEGTIRDNICMGKNDVTNEEIVKASKVVEAHTFIENLPSGYDTVVGTTGTRLSGGEKQRICLARAILKKAPILILDEPTSHLDGTIERKIFESIKAFCPDKIVLFITHRMATVENADRIYVFNDGEIIAEGHHRELVSQCKKYENMWELANRARNWSFEAGR